MDPQTVAIFDVDYDPDTKYGFICIEDIECEVCGGAACSGFQGQFEDKWRSDNVTFYEENVEYKFESSITYECPAAHGFEDGSTEVTIDCRWNGTWTPVDSLPDCLCMQFAACN